MNRYSYRRGVVRNDPSKVRFFKKDYTTYQILLSEDANKVKESYEVKVSYIYLKCNMAKKWRDLIN